MRQQAHEPGVKSLDAVTSLVLSVTSEVCGSELSEEAEFASHHFDSLSAVELASGISKAVGVKVPSEPS